MKIFKHIGRLLKDIFAFAWQNKIWWIFPMVVMLLLMSLLIIVGKASAPFIYTLF